MIEELRGVTELLLSNSCADPARAELLEDVHLAEEQVARGAGLEHEAAQAWVTARLAR